MRIFCILKFVVLSCSDFGLATRFCNNSFMSTRAGTPFYVAPQVLQGKYTYKCDIWSAGVILYILLCGYPPFHGENDAEILARVKVGRFTFNDQDWKGVSSEAKDLVRKLMAFDPHRENETTRGLQCTDTQRGAATSANNKLQRQKHKDADTPFEILERDL